jgi:hypothetical protein
VTTKSIGATALLALVALVGYGVWSFAARSGGAEPVVAYGNVGNETAPTVSVAALVSGDHSGPATVEGTVVDMGPTMGCWLVVDDGTGRLLVQSDPMVYVDQAMRGKTIRATGELAMLNGGMGFSGQTLALLTSGVVVAGDGAAG